MNPIRITGASMFRTLDHCDLCGTVRRLALALLALLALSSLAAPVLAGADLQRVGALPHLQTAAPSGRVVVKLDPASGLVMDRSGLAVRPGAPDRTAAKAADLGALVRSLAPGARLEKRIPTAPVKCRFDVLRKLKKPKLEQVSTTRTAQDRKRFAKIANAVLAGINAGIYMPQPSWMCSDCSYSDVCKAW